MKPDCYAGLRQGEVGIDKESGKYIVVTNCVCMLSHDTPEKYEKSHGDGCLMVPFEGLVVTVDGGGKVVTWNMQNVRETVISRISKTDGDEIKKQIDEILEAQRRADRKNRNRR